MEIKTKRIYFIDISKGNINFFDKVTQMISPPRVLLIGITGIIVFLRSL